MIYLEIETSQLRRLNGQFASWTKIFGAEIDQAFEQLIAPQLLEALSEATPVSDKEEGEHAADQWEFKSSGSVSGGVKRMDFINRSGYLNIVISGRRPGIIHGNPILKFIGADGGEYYRSEVYHPGFGPNDFVEETFNKNERVLLQELDASVRIALTRIFAL